jgi:tetratricopeptide (TPR) repeat protein
MIWSKEMQNEERRFALKQSWCRALLLVALAVCFPLSEAAGADSGDGGTESIFSLGAGSRAISLGRAFVSVADDASAVYWNPAALRNVQSKQIMGMYMPVFGDFTEGDYTFFSAVYPTLNAGAFGLGFMRSGTTFRGYDVDSRPTGEGDYSESQVIISYAVERHSRYLLGSLATGMSFKIANQKVSPYSSTSPGVDLGFRLIPDVAKSFAIGINFQDLSGPRHKLFQETDRTYRTVLAGVGYTRVLSSGGAIRVNMQLDLPEKADRQFHMGAEYAHSRYLSFRLGLDRGNFSFGLGVNVSGFGLDYAMLSRDEAGSSHPISFTTSFGKTLYEQRTLLDERRRREDALTVQRAFATRVQTHRENALAYEAQGELPFALDQWKIVLEYMPGDTEAQNHIDSVQQQLIREQEVADRDREKQAVISAHFSQGLDLYQENDYIRARDEWRTILSIDPEHEEAQQYLRRTQDKIDELIAGHLRRAGTLEDQNRLTEAIGEWTNVQALAPNDERADEAVRRIQRKIENQSQDLRTKSQRLQIVNLYGDALQAYNEGRYETAIDDLEEILRLEPSHQEARALLARAKRRTTPLTEEEEASIRKLYLNGMQYFAKDQYTQAIAEWEKILEIDPANESVRKNIEEAQERLKKLEGQSD